MDVRLQERRRLELDLRRALVAGEFVLHYQPLLNVADHRISGCEALIRWRHPTRGMVMPNDFIPLTEEIGLIVPLGEWIIRQACADGARLPDNMKMAVNLSPAQFRSPRLVPTVIQALAASGLPPERLELEITESVLLDDSVTNLRVLHELRALGVRICMDDFGTGYSSLSYLRSFPFDKIKIDRSFVADLQDDKDANAIVKAVTGLGHSLGMMTTAEGVETDEQLNSLRAQGCTEAQGYLISRPIEHQALLTLVRDFSPGLRKVG
jgi:EAL domain-containing protein (putative c-di-GMP-specific phosphodiesterase class I)